jgi:thioredoxin-related protein
MKHSKIIILTLVLGIIFAFTDAFPQKSYSFNEGLKLAKSQNKKLLINICVDSDSWCEKMKSVYGNDKVKSLIKKYFIYVKLNAQGTEKYSYNGKTYTASELAKLFGVTGYPTHVFLNPDGSIIYFLYNGNATGNFSGYLDEDEFVNLLEYIAANKYKDTDLSTVL